MSISGGNIAVVTGAAQGIGKAITENLANNGFIVCCIDIQSEKLNVLCQNENCIPYLCDVSKPEQVIEVFSKIEKKFKKVDVLINNAAVFSTMSFVESTFEEAIEDYQFNMNTNMLGTFLCTKVVSQLMVQNKKGMIINVNTNHIKRNLFSVSKTEHSYDSSKYAQLSLTQSAAKELIQYGIRVNAICPAATRTPMLESYFDKSELPITLEVMKRYVHNASLLEPEDVARAVLGMIFWPDTEPVGNAYLLMFPKDCDELAKGHVERLSQGKLE